MRTLLGRVLIISGAVLFAYSEVQAQPARATEAIAAAKARQDAITSAEFTIKVTDDFVKGGLSALSAAKPRVPVPADDAHFTATNRLAFSGTTIRYDDNYAVALMQNGELAQRRLVTALDSGTKTDFLPDGLGPAATPSGVIRVNSRIDENVAIDLLPIFVTFRALEPSLCLKPLAEATATGNTFVIGGATCQEFVLALGHDTNQHFWLDPQRAYIARRIARKQKDRLFDQHDIVYRADATAGWVPASWVYQRFTPSGDVVATRRMEVIEVQFNVPIAEERLEIRFPPGAQVQDTRIMKDYSVQADGRWVEITLVPSWSARADRWLERYRWLIVAVVLIGADALLLVYAARRFRPKRAPSTA